MKKEADKLRQRVSTMEGYIMVHVCVHTANLSIVSSHPPRLQRVLRDTKEEVETLVKNYSSPTKLATFVVAMKR